MTTDWFCELLSQFCAMHDIMLTDGQLHQFTLYKDLLLEWNTRMNLTAITDSNEIAVKHFADSLSVLKAVSIQNDASIIDIGTGAGFPGVPLKIMHPDLQLTLLDSLNKRLVFLESLIKELHLTAAFVHGRAEEIGRKSNHREQYDLVTARAVSSLRTLCEYCLPFVRLGGHFAAMKGPSLSQELESSQNAIQLLGGQIVDIYHYTLSDGSDRNIAVIQKVKETPAKYPRHSAKIAKSPL